MTQDKKPTDEEMGEITNELMAFLITHSMHSINPLIKDILRKNNNEKTDIEKKLIDREFDKVRENMLNNSADIMVYLTRRIGNFIVAMKQRHGYVEDMYNSESFKKLNMDREKHTWTDLR